AVDGYAAESMTDAERPIGTSIIVFLAVVAGVLGSGVVALVETFGWPTTMTCASLLLLGAATPAIIRREPPPPEASRKRRERGERPNLWKAVKRPEARYILPFLFCFGFGGAFFGAMVGPFLADKGLSLTQFGILSPISAIAGSGLAALVTPILIRNFGVRTAAIVGLSILPIEGVVFMVFALMPGLPPLPIFVTIVALLGFGTAIYSFAVNNSRFRWASKAQAATDYSMQSSLWNFGIWVAGSLAGFVVAAVGWAIFFPLAAGLATAFALFYVLTFERIEALVQAREADELAD
ncbi:MAG: MFS transporter, partial [Gammaproteobacteria bacterium]